MAIFTDEEKELDRRRYYIIVWARQRFLRKQDKELEEREDKERTDGLVLKK